MGVRLLYPGYFALAMATGIVSTAVGLVGHPTLSASLLVIDVACFAVLCLLNAIRVARFPRDVVADLATPERAYGFFTFVAACNVLGTRLAVDGHRTATQVLAVVSAVAWTGLSYGVLAQLVLGSRPRPVLAGVNGTWFIWVVGTQSLSIATAVLERDMSHSSARAAALAATLLWSVGVVLYIILTTLVLVRLLTFEVTVNDLSGPYWITMGATAITVLAGAQLLQMGTTPVAVATHSTVAGVSVVLWAFGTWTVPLLLVFSVWRFVVSRRLHYAPPQWSVVFPLGMYSAASIEISRAAQIPIVGDIGRAEVWVAVAAWVIVFAGMLQQLSALAFARRVSV